MPNYTVSASSISNPTVNTEDAFIEIAAAAGSALRIKRVAIAMGTPNSDARISALFRRTSTAGATPAAGTAVRRDPATRASSATPTVKNGTANFSIGTPVDLPWAQNINGRGLYEWVPRNYMEEIIVPGGQRFVVGLACSVASQSITVVVEYED